MPPTVAATGQVISYQADDDGYYQSDLTWPYPRFANSGPNTITDNFTGLMWYKTVDRGSRTWPGSLSYIDNLNAVTKPDGYGDWRLPNIFELQSILFISGDNTDAITLITEHASFSQFYGDFFWTSTTCAPDGTKAWYIGNAGWPGSWNCELKTTAAASTFAVRGEATGPLFLPKTGQSSYATGDDGYYQKGLTFPTLRFKDNGDGTITDNLTGLMWLAAPDAIERTWPNAITYVGGLTTGTHTDWRLPISNELRSLINYTQVGNATWLNSQGFSNIQSNDVYWSSSTDYGSLKWHINLDTGIGGAEGTTNPNYVLAVRGNEPKHPTIRVTNIRRNSLLESGFITGTASSATGSVQLVEVQFDRGGYTAAITADGYANWKKAIPSGASTWKKGSMHIINVRSRDNAGNYSHVTYAKVRKGTNKDVNGDGYADVGVGARQITLGGSAYIYHGGPTGLSSTPDTTITGEAAGYRFGHAVAFGDINGDGYADLAVGADTFDNSNPNSDNGAVYIFYGSPAGIASINAASAPTRIRGVEKNDFGAEELATGDVNGDGYDDLGAGAFATLGSDADSQTFIFHGGPAGIASGLSTSVATTYILDEGADYAPGKSIAFGDINGDGYVDLVFSAKYLLSGDGKVYIFYGTGANYPSGTVGGAGLIPDASLVGETGTDEALGNILVLGDYNSDGYQDLGVGAIDYLNNSNQGRVYVFKGESGGLNSTAVLIKIGGAAGNYFGN